MRGAALAMVVVAAAVGAASGIGLYTFVYARGASYLTDDPAACANCHVMNEQYNGWLKASHTAAAVCNDCHTPPGLVPKYTTKMLNGFWHSFAFTTGRFHEPIRITTRNRNVTEKACRACHTDMVEAMEGPHGQIGAVSCIRCHSSVGHPESTAVGMNRSPF